MGKCVNINNMQTTTEEKMNIKDYISISIIALAFILITGIAKAEEFKTISGSVVGVEAIYETKNIHEPHEHCTIQEVPIYGQDQGANIVGAIIGGYIGSKIGGGKGNDIAIGTGAVIGSQIGNKKIVGYKQVRTCETTYTTSLQKVLNYYIISWKSNDGMFSGKAKSTKHWTTGDHIKVRLIAQPVL